MVLTTPPKARGRAGPRGSPCTSEHTVAGRRARQPTVTPASPRGGDGMGSSRCSPDLRGPPAKPLSAAVRGRLGRGEHIYDPRRGPGDTVYGQGRTPSPATTSRAPSRAGRCQRRLARPGPEPHSGGAATAGTRSNVAQVAAYPRAIRAARGWFPRQVAMRRSPSWVRTFHQAVECRHATRRSMVSASAKGSIEALAGRRRSCRNGAPSRPRRRWIARASRRCGDRPPQGSCGIAVGAVARRVGGLVGARGFEPPTSSSRTMRATKLRHAPTESAR